MEVIMDKRVTGVVAYLTILGWFVAYIAGDRRNAKFHLNQGLVVHLSFIVLFVLMRVPIVRIFASVLQIAVLVVGIMGLVYALREQDYEIPILGCIKLFK